MSSIFVLFFFFNDTATTEIYTLSLHDALPISKPAYPRRVTRLTRRSRRSPRVYYTLAGVFLGLVLSAAWTVGAAAQVTRSEEHTSELQSRLHLVCRLLLEKKKRRLSIQHNLSC